MQRLALVSCLIAAVFVNGCASKSPFHAANSDYHKRPPKWVRHDDWGDDHPLLDMTAKSVCIALVGIGVLALAVGLVILSAQVDE